MKPKFLLAAFASLYFFGKMVAQPARDWDKSFGGNGWDELHFIRPQADGSLLIGGNTASQTGYDVSQATFGMADFWLLKTDSDGKKIADFVFGGSQEDKLWDLLTLADGGFLLGGYSASPISGNKTTAGFGGNDYWLVRLDKNFHKIWEKTIGGSGDDQLFKLVPTADGNFLLAGFSNSPADGLKTTAPLGGYDWWVLKINELGDILWQKSYGGSAFDNLYDAVATPDGGFLLGGSTDSAPGGGSILTQQPRGQIDFWVVKIDGEGNPEWNRRWGGAERDQLQQILPLRDGNYLLLGGSASLKQNDRTAESFGFFDDWIIKIRPSGDQIWQKSYGGSGFDHLYRGLETVDGKLLLAGTSDSPVSGNHTSPGFGGYDFWLVYANENGEMLWNKSYGGNKIDAVTDLVQQTDGDFSLILGGHSLSGESGFHSQNSHGQNDLWLLKTFCGIRSDLPTDTLVCQRNLILLDPKLTGCTGGDCEIRWSNGSTTTTTTVRPDSFSIQKFLALDGNACGLRDSIFIETLPSPTIALGPDTTLFKDEIWQMDISSPEIVSYGWSTGAAGPKISISEETNLAVEVTGDNGCTARDTIHVCPCRELNVYIPNIFAPNLNLYNDIFLVFADPKAVTEIRRLTVFDRFGITVFNRTHFQPNDKSLGWDGTLFGKRVDPGVFMYDCDVLFANGKTRSFVGSVTLIR